jgi:hypothetical protein
MITRNSVERLGGLFKEVLTSSLSVPYKAFILVDDSQSDKTFNEVARFASEHGKELIATRSRLPAGWDRPTRATARQTAIDIFFENFNDEWLMFLDDDFILSTGYWREASQYIEILDIGEIWGINWDSNDTRSRFLNLLKRIGVSKIDYKDYLIDAFNRRGGTHDTLYRRKSIEGVVIPPDLHFYEDAWLHHYVRCRGFKSAIVYDSGRHLSSPGDFSISDEKKRWEIALITAIKYGIVEHANIEKAIRYGGNLLRWSFAWLSLIQPLATLPLRFIADYAVSKDIRKTLIYSLKKQYAKIWNRYITLKVARKVRGRLPDVCKCVLQTDECRSRNFAL